MTNSLALALVAFLAAFPAVADEHHFSPEECLDTIDAREIAAATQSIDLASYALTDRIVIDALLRADARGVKVRIVLDPRVKHDFRAIVPLADNVRVKRGGPLMHLKAYAVDGSTLRSGSANFSPSGECEQENELSISRDPADAARFERVFEKVWRSGEELIDFPAAAKAAEPE